MKDFMKSMHDQDQIIKTDREALERHPGIRFAYLFGSLPRKVSSRLSDIDIAVYLDDSADPVHEKMDLIGHLMSELGTDEIDLVLLNSAPLPLTARVLEHNEIIIDREPFQRHVFESLILKKYFDFSVKEKGILDRRFFVGR